MYHLSGTNTDQWARTDQQRTHYPPEFDTPATTRSYPITICRKIRKLGIADHHHLCILIQVLVRLWPGSYRREYRPLQNPTLTPYEPFTWNPYSLRPLEPSTNFSPPTDCYGPAILLCGPLRTCSTRCEPSPTRYKTPSTRYESFPPVTSFFQPSTTFADALRYTIWQIYVGKSMMVRRSGARDLTLHLRMTLTTMSSLRPLNTHITSLQITTCGNNTKKILQTL